MTLKNFKLHLDAEIEKNSENILVVTEYRFRYELMPQYFIIKLNLIMFSKKSE